MAQTDPVILKQSDFDYGTYIIDRPGLYRLGENISFSPNSLDRLRKDVAARRLDLPTPVEAYDSNMPMFAQFRRGPAKAFTPGGPTDARYDPRAYGIGFFAAIAIQAENVTLDLNGFTLEQSAEHALMQRFFALIELADQPFIPSQGPAAFGETIESARNVVIKNGTLGRSAHHGIHGNANENVKIQNVNFVDYEVAAVALNGVNGLAVENVIATNRKDVPVLGTFSSAMFIKPYIDDMMHRGSRSTLIVNRRVLNVTDIRSALRASINAVYADVIERKHLVDGRPSIDAARHPEEYALFHNPHGLVDGNAYSFLLNHVGLAVNGFPTRPDGKSRIPSKDVAFRNVHVSNQRAFINEVPAIAVGSTAAIDPIGAVFQVFNTHPDTAKPITMSSSDPAKARYTGNVVANAQALIAKAALDGDVGSGRLDRSRMNIPEPIIAWVEAKAGSETLSSTGTGVYCNGDSMFHVNKGVIGFKIDSTTGATLENTSVQGLHNLGAAGTARCGEYTRSRSHPLAKLIGYGGAHARGYTFAGSEKVRVINAMAKNLRSIAGSAEGVSVLTDSSNIELHGLTAIHIIAGRKEDAASVPPNADRLATALSIGKNTSDVYANAVCAKQLRARDKAVLTVDDSMRASFGNAEISDDACFEVLMPNLGDRYTSSPSADNAPVTATPE